MVVWVIYNDANDGSAVNGVFSSEEKVIQWFEKRNIEIGNGYWYEDYVVDAKAS